MGGQKLSALKKVGYFLGVVGSIIVLPVTPTHGGPNPGKAEIPNENPAREERSGGRMRAGSVAKEGSDQADLENKKQEIGGIAGPPNGRSKWMTIKGGQLVDVEPPTLPRGAPLPKTPENEAVRGLVETYARNVSQADRAFRGSLNQVSKTVKISEEALTDINKALLAGKANIRSAMAPAQNGVTFANPKVDLRTTLAGTEVGVATAMKDMHRDVSKALGGMEQGAEKALATLGPAPSVEPSMTAGLSNALKGITETKAITKTSIGMDLT